MRLAVISEKIGSFGAVVSAMGCASCFPALGLLGTSIGLGFLAGFEGLIINVLLPLFAAVAAVSAVLSWWFHGQPQRGFLGIAGPLLVLATLYLFWSEDWRNYLFYFALLLMLVAGIRDLVSPPRSRCAVTDSGSEV